MVNKGRSVLGKRPSPLPLHMGDAQRTLPSQKRLMRQLFPVSELPIDIILMRIDGGPSPLPPAFLLGVAAVALTVPANSAYGNNRSSACFRHRPAQGTETGGRKHDEYQL